MGVEGRDRDVGEQHAKSDRQQQQRLKLLDNCQVEQNAGDNQHHCLLPADIGEARVYSDVLDGADKHFKHLIRSSEFNFLK